MAEPFAPENDYRAIAPRHGAAQLRVAVVIPVYNRVGLLARTVASLAVQSYPAELLSVVVADDGSEEDVAGALAPLRDRLDLHVVRREHEGYGAGAARNLGARAADADLLVFIDADCMADPELVARHAAWHHASGGVVTIGSRHHVDSTDLAPEELAGGAADLRGRAFGTAELPGAALVPDDWRALLYRRTGRLRRGDEAFRALVSSNFAVLRERFLAVGGFDESFTRWGGEDTELGWRLAGEGLFIVPEDGAVAYHQTQEDAGPAPDWRQRARATNDGMVRTKIPHRFYRKESERGFVYERPKVSVIVAPPTPGRARALHRQLLGQNLTDWEALFVGDDPGLVVLAEELRADPRMRRIPEEEGLPAALRAAEGELVGVLHGAASLDHRLLSRAVQRMDRQPRAGMLTVGYRLPGAQQPEDHRRQRDVAALDAAWRDDGLPVFGLARRRDLARARGDAASPARAWATLLGTVRREHLDQALVGLAGRDPSADGDPPAFVASSMPRQLLTLGHDLRRARGPRQAAGAVRRYAGARRGGPSDASPPARPASGAERPDAPHAPVPARYIGWVGHDNLGDEALHRAISGLLPWAELRTSGEAERLLALGGGTLINGGYLAQLERFDRPRVERVVFGTGVTNPEYWGPPRESPQAWVDFLETCGFVGVRGPTSAELLRSWGYDGPLEVIGDPALDLRPPVTERRPGRVVVNVARTRDLLWGGSDAAVQRAVAELMAGLLAEGRDVHLLSCFPGDDHPGIQVMRDAGTPDLPYLAGYRSIDEALALMASADLVVGERLHALVLAAACGTPFVGVEYRPKVRDFARSLETEGWLVRSDAVDGEGLLERVRAADAETTQRRAHLDARVAAQRQVLAEAAERVRELVA